MPEVLVNELKHSLIDISLAWDTVVESPKGPQGLYLQTFNYPF